MNWDLNSCGSLLLLLLRTGCLPHPLRYRCELASINFSGGQRHGPEKGLRLYYREGNYADAIQFFDRALEIDPSLAYAWHDRGVCLRQLGRNEEALKNVDRAVALAPDDEELAFTRADLLRKIGILQEHHKVLEAAARAYNKVVEINPDHADAWNGLGICMKELGKDELSRQYFERAQDLVRWGKSRKKTRNLDSLV